MKLLFALIFLLFISPAQAISPEKEIVLVEFVNVVRGNWQEALYYFENNWLVIRETAKKKGIISSFRMVSFQDYPGREFDILLITEYENSDKYKKSEERLSKLVKSKGAPELLNELNPNDFRKTIFKQKGVQYWQMD